MKTEFEQMVSDLIKPGATILATLTPEKVNVWHMATGITGEAGELLDAIKKHVAYNKPLDVVNVVEELGDLEFYMEGLRQALNITRQETLDRNIEKLRKGTKEKAARYAAGYSDQAATDRADKA